MAYERWSAFDERTDNPRSNRANKSDLRLLKSKARKNDDITQTAYEEGVKEGTHAARQKARQRKARLQARKRKYPVARKVAGKVRQPVSSGTARGVRQLQAPVASQVAGSVRLAGLSLGVVALYLFLENATAVSGVLGSVARGVEWLKAPDKSVPYVSKG